MEVSRCHGQRKEEEREEESHVILSTSGRSLLLIYPLPSPSCAVTLLLPAVRSSVPAGPLSSGKVPCAITWDDAWAWVYRNNRPKLWTPPSGSSENKNRNNMVLTTCKRWDWKRKGRKINVKSKNKNKKNAENYLPTNPHTPQNCLIRVSVVDDRLPDGR